MIFNSHVVVLGEKVFGILCKCGHFRSEHRVNFEPEKLPSKAEELLNKIAETDGLPDDSAKWYNCVKCSCEKYNPRKKEWQFWKK